jgi:hypothetical protein
MTEKDFGDLRPWLDEHEQYARSIKSGDPRYAVAQDILAIVARARESLLPSADSTANYVQSKEVIEQLATLRNDAEKALKGNG